MLLQCNVFCNANTLTDNTDFKKKKKNSGSQPEAIL